MEKKALFPGTFNPPSLGHLEIIRRASKICDKLYVGVAKNIAKTDTLFSLEERKELLREMIKPFSNVEVAVLKGLVVEFAKDKQVDFIVRGLRAFSNFEKEFQMALANRKMGGIETVFLITDKSFSHISSTLIREVGMFGHRLHDFVPAEIEERVFQKILENKQRELNKRH